MRHVRARVLHIGCGAGRHSIYLQRRGHDVLGIDISLLATEVCRQKSLREARVMSMTQASPGVGVFDTIPTLANNFGLFGSFKKARWLLARFRGMTFGEGRISAKSQ